VLFVVGWVLMAAMMLPTALPLLEVFRRLTARRTDRRQLMVLLITGYLAVWAVFGVAAHFADSAVLFFARRSEWLIANSCWRSPQ
jgi:predicted metal-binding membrane protein